MSVGTVSHRASEWCSLLRDFLERSKMPAVSPVFPVSLRHIVCLMLLSSVKGGGKGVRIVLGLSLCGHENYEIGYL